MLELMTKVTPSYLPNETTKHMLEQDCNLRDKPAAPIFLQILNKLGK